MTKPTLITLCCLLLTACGHQKARQQQDAPGETFRHEVILKTTPVKQQGNSDLCWIYAMLATIETEHLMYGDSVNLSPTFQARHLLADEASKRLASRGTHRISTRGMMTMTMRLLQLHGAMPFSSYHVPDRIDYKGIISQLHRAADQAYAHRQSMKAFGQKVEQVLDNGMGTPPQWVFMLSCEYTPEEFAHSLYTMQEYTALTSFSHHPYGQHFALEVPDNRYDDVFLNLPLDTLMHCIDNALRNGHPVCWEGDTSEPGFDFPAGTARLDDHHTVITQEKRQQLFDHQQTTDDHCMEMMGIAYDSKGRKYYVCKNSWGNNRYGGYMYMEEDYVRAKTIAVVIPNAALPPLDITTNRGIDDYFNLR